MGIWVCSFSRVPLLASCLAVSIHFCGGHLIAALITLMAELLTAHQSQLVVATQPVALMPSARMLEFSVHMELQPSMELQP